MFGKFCKRGHWWPPWWVLAKEIKIWLINLQVDTCASNDEFQCIWRLRHLTRLPSVRLPRILFQWFHENHGRVVVSALRDSFCFSFTRKIHKVDWTLTKLLLRFCSSWAICCDFRLSMLTNILMEFHINSEVLKIWSAAASSSDEVLDSEQCDFPRSECALTRKEEWPREHQWC